MKRWPCISLLISILAACNSSAQVNDLPVLDYFEIDYKKFGEYWYSGEAELTSYTLIQNRYGEDREGTSVMIFVTEPFSESKQVKLDNPDGTEVTVMKLNYTRNFTTGIYPYSMMLSAFTPVSDDQFPMTLKATMSSQEWCGHTFSQFNLKSKRYHFSGRSYFESEGDEDRKLNPALLEDEIWNRIRLNPNKLPTGEFLMIPGSFYARLAHIEFEPRNADGILDYKADQSTYMLHYPESGRTLKITFESEFPFTILTWEEMLDNQVLSKGTRNKSLKTDYWNKNAMKFEYLRDSLDLH